jgi:hypothetical protein
MLLLAQADWATGEGASSLGQAARLAAAGAALEPDLAIGAGTVAFKVLSGVIDITRKT